jgi:cellobiose phosphorylase
LQKSLLGNLVPDLVTGPPHQQSNYFVGPDSEFYGQNQFNNFTGSMAWYRVGIEKMLGVIPQYDGLKISPSVPSTWNEYKVRRNFRDIDLEFHFKRTGKFSIVADGKNIEGSIIPTTMLKTFSKCNIEITF